MTERFSEIPKRIKITGDQEKGHRLINIAVDRLRLLREQLRLQQGLELDLSASRRDGEMPAWKTTRHEVAYNTIELDDGSKIKTSINYGLARIEIEATTSGGEKKEEVENLKCFCNLTLTSGVITGPVTWEHDDDSECPRRFDAMVCSKHCKIKKASGQATTSDHAEYDLDNDPKGTFLFVLVAPNDNVLTGGYYDGSSGGDPDVTGCCPRLLSPQEKADLDNAGGHLDVVIMCLPIMVWSPKRIFAEVDCKCV